LVALMAGSVGGVMAGSGGGLDAGSVGGGVMLKHNLL
jgi:hypothetical protein